MYYLFVLLFVLNYYLHKHLCFIDLTFRIIFKYTTSHIVQKVLNVLIKFNFIVNNDLLSCDTHLDNVMFKLYV